VTLTIVQEFNELMSILVAPAVDTNPMRNRKTIKTDKTRFIVALLSKIIILKYKQNISHLQRYSIKAIEIN
jgi:hypothetical protein